MLFIIRILNELSSFKKDKEGLKAILGLGSLLLVAVIIDVFLAINFHDAINLREREGSPLSLLWWVYSIIMGAVISFYVVWGALHGPHVIHMSITRGMPFIGTHVEITDGPHKGATGEVREPLDVRDCIGIALGPGPFFSTELHWVPWNEIRVIKGDKWGAIERNWQMKKQDLVPPHWPRWVSRMLTTALIFLLIFIAIMAAVFIHEINTRHL